MSFFPIRTNRDHRGVARRLVEHDACRRSPILRLPATNHVITEVVMTLLPSALKATVVTSAAMPGNVTGNRVLLIFQMRAVLSPEPVTSRFPSGLNATADRIYGPGYDRRSGALCVPKLRRPDLPIPSQPCGRRD